MKKEISKESFFAVSWQPKECHRNMTKGFRLVSEYIGQPLYYCRLATSQLSKDDAISSLNNSITYGDSAALKIMSIRAYPGGIDNTSGSLEIYESHGHSFYVSIIPDAKPDADGFYGLNDLLVHDPGLLPLKNLREGMAFYEYLQFVAPGSDKLFFSFEFFADPALSMPAPIPPYTFSFSVPKMSPPVSVYQPPSRESRAATVIQRNWRNHAAILSRRAVSLGSLFQQAINSSLKHSPVFVDIKPICLDVLDGYGGNIKNFLKPSLEVFIREVHIQACGFISLSRAYHFFKLIHNNISVLPKRVVAVGSGNAFWERGFQILGLDVIASDKEVRSTSFMPVLQAELPGEIDKVLPEDCSDCMLFSAYPEGYLGDVVEAFRLRGGSVLVCHVEGVACKNFSHLNSDMHAGYEPERGKKLLHETRNLIKGDGKSVCISVDVSPNLPYSYSDFMSSIEVFNFPTGESADPSTRLPGWTHKQESDDGSGLTYCVHDNPKLSNNLEKPMFF